ncbi:MAG TPA: DUF1801 domain-containing protein [Planctomycetaceae bacterium]|nr:DUF1801 domain-containing protein [Planctomycetaceae bacterium]
MAKPKAKRAAHASRASKPAAKSTKTAKAGAKAKPGAAKPVSREQASGQPASRLIDQRSRDLPIRDMDGWREETLARMRALILEADPEMIEERKWRKPSNAMAGVPVWSHNGIVCTGETYTKVVKLTFAQGAKLPDPSRLFNSSLEGNTRRAIDIHEGKQVDAAAFKALVKAAVAQNGPPAKKARPAASEAKPVKLLSGGNPQIAKAHGDAPVQAYVAAMPGWKGEIGRWLDTIVVRNVPNVRKTVKWNTPFYGIDGQGWFLGFHCLAKSVKVAFFRGTSLQPVPPGASKSKETRYVDIREGDPLDETQMATWVKQAAALPGWVS